MNDKYILTEEGELKALELWRRIQIIGFDVTLASILEVVKNYYYLNKGRHKYLRIYNLNLAH